LPNLKDEEGNDTPELYVNSMPSQPFPPFLYYDNDTTTLAFTPQSIWFTGYTYYFVIVVKEKNSDSVVYPYFCTIKMGGVSVNPEDHLNFTELNFTLGTI
jgi:hypothetical protein